MPHLIFIPFLFVLGACIGSFLNVVVYRLPREESLFYPPSRCPKCNNRLAWYDNVPVLGWVLLRGKCRYCGQPISPRYPIVEAITGGLFVFYYVMFFIAGAGPCLMPSEEFSGWFRGAFTSILNDWPIYFLYMFAISSLLAASLIDAELFIIPAGIPWWMAGVGIAVHAITDTPSMPGNLLVGNTAMALSAGAAIGLLVSIVLLRLGVLPISFAEGGPLLEVEKEELAKERKEKADGGADVAEGDPPEFTPAQIRAEMRKEMLFLMPPLVLGALSVLALRIPAVAALWASAAQYDWLRALLGSLLGALVGGFVVWITRIGGSVGFGKEAMGLGDVHLMFGVGAVIGAGPSTLAFFLAPFCGLALAVYLLLTGTRRQLPYGPYLSLATAVVMLFYCPILERLGVVAGLEGLAIILRRTIGGT